MPNDTDLMTYIFLALAAFLFLMIFANVLGGPRRRQRRKRFEGGKVSDTSGAADAGRLLQPRGRRQDGDGGSDGADGDGGGGDGGGGGGD